MDTANMTPEHTKSREVAKAVEKINAIASFFSNTSTVSKYLTVLVVLALHFFASIKLEDFSWFGASGNIVSILALMLVFYESSLASFDDDVKNVYLEEETPEQLKTFAADAWAPCVSPLHIPRVLSIRRKTFNEKYQNTIHYFYFTIIGALIASYGEFLNPIFGFTN